MSKKSRQSDPLAHHLSGPPPDASAPRLADPLRTGTRGGRAAVDFSTLIGPLASLDRLLQVWDRLIDGPEMRLVQRPAILPFPDWAEPYATGALRVAVFRFRPDVGPAIVARIRGNLDRFGLSDIHVELGYYYEPAATRSYPQRQRRWEVRWRPEHLHRLQRTRPVTLPAGALGAQWVGSWRDPRRIVLIDTGDEGAPRQTAFEEVNVCDESPRDYNGHGTSIGSLIRLVAPRAEVHSFRVLAQGEAVAESSNLINAMDVATLSSGLFDVVCVPQRGELSVLAGGLQDGLKIVLHWNARRRVQMPVVVCAAGNKAPAPMEFPATIPGVMVAIGQDAYGGRAPYNCRTAPGAPAYEIGAFGGLAEDPIGSLNGSRILYGSSYATALVTVALVNHRPILRR